MCGFDAIGNSTREVHTTRTKRTSWLQKAYRNPDTNGESQLARARCSFATRWVAFRSFAKRLSMTLHAYKNPAQIPHITSRSVPKSHTSVHVTLRHTFTTSPVTEYRSPAIGTPDPPYLCPSVEPRTRMRTRPSRSCRATPMTVTSSAHATRSSAVAAQTPGSKASPSRTPHWRCTEAGS